MKKSSNFFKYFIILFVISGALVLGSFFGVLNPVIGPATRIVSPVVSFFDSLSQKIKGNDTDLNVEELKKNNDDLRRKINELTLEISALKELKVENESLRAQLKFSESIAQKTVAATVVSRDPSNFSKTIVIDRGSKNGIKKGMAVLSDGFFAGKIYDVTSYTATVLLLTDSNFEISGFVQESRALGLVKGQIGSGLVMEMIPQDEKVSINDTIVTSNIQSEIPEGLVVGKVTEVDKESQGLFQKASVVPFINLEQLKYVVIVLGG